MPLQALFHNLWLRSVWLCCITEGYPQSCSNHIYFYSPSTLLMEASMSSEYDMLFEILTRATLETVDTCKVVSKDLNKLLNDSCFIKNHSLTTKNVFGYFVQTILGNYVRSTFVSIDPTLSTPSIALEFFEDGLKILASSSQGILCCGRYKTWSSYKYYVCKPSTKQCVELPSPRGQDIRTIKHSQRVALVILKSKPLHYKIIRFGETRCL